MAGGPPHMRLNADRTEVIGGVDPEMVQILGRDLGFEYDLVREKYQGWHPEGSLYLVRVKFTWLKLFFV